MTSGPGRPKPQDGKDGIKLTRDELEKRYGPLKFTNIRRPGDKESK